MNGAQKLASISWYILQICPFLPLKNGPQNNFWVHCGIGWDFLAIGFTSSQYFFSKHVNFVIMVIKLIAEI